MSKRQRSEPDHAHQGNKSERATKIQKRSLLWLRSRRTTSSPATDVSSPPANTPKNTQGTWSNSSSALVPPTPVLPPRKHFPRTAYTAEMNDTAAVRDAMLKAAGQESSHTSSTTPIFNHTWPTTDIIALLAALLSVPVNREARIYCNSSWAVNSVCTRDKKTGRYVWLPPTENFIPSAVSEDGSFQIRDLIEEVRKTVERRAREGCRTWIDLVGLVGYDSEEEGEEHDAGKIGAGGWI